MSAQEAEQRLRRADFLIQELDTNHNGIIEADEVDGRRKFFVDRLLQRAGLEANYPVTIVRVREGLQRYYQAAVAGTLPPGGLAPGSQPPGSPGAAATTPTQPLVPGFGVAASPAAPTVPGFGGTMLASAGTAAQPSAAVASSSTLPPPKNDEEAKVRQYAKSLLQQYDKNKNGVLEPDEWKEMRGDVKAADINGDGKITLEELTNWLIKQGQQSGHSHGESRESRDSRGPGEGRGSSSSSGKDKRSPYRFSTATERLPSGLPDWFLQKDADADGQVSMAEFATEWTDAKVAEFRRYDLNGDGVITAAECLAVEKAKDKDKEKKK
jgi:Ca2+-binding EF-hand superfamily protein